MSIDTGGPAFPHHAHDWNPSEPGMTLRDYFAAKAMAAMVSTDTWEVTTDPADAPSISPTDVAREAYEIADAMIAARSHTTKEK